MIFKENNFLFDNSFEKTMNLEGGRTVIFFQRALGELNLDCKGLDYFEVGPKHGLHTMIIDNYNPNSITCIDAPTKIRNKKWLNQSVPWISHIKTENFTIAYEDFSNYVSKNKYDILNYSGVLYHNINQIHHLEKLYSLGKPGSFLIIESSTTRNKELEDKNVIEVHHPPYSDLYNNTPSITFHPSKKALMSMLDTCGWEVIKSQDEYDDLKVDGRLALLCVKKDKLRKNLHTGKDY